MEMDFAAFAKEKPEVVIKRWSEGILVGGEKGNLA